MSHFYLIFYCLKFSYEIPAAFGTVEATGGFLLPTLDLEADPTPGFDAIKSLTKRLDFQ